MYNVSYGAEDSEEDGAEVLLGPNKGSSEQVKEWQAYLVKKGYNLGQWCIDGDFGSATQAATRALGRDLGVETDGSLTRALGNAAPADDVAVDVTTAQKDAGCPGWRGSSSTAVATTEGKTEGTTPAAPGVIGKVAKATFTPRGMLVGGSILLLGIGLFGIARERF